MNPYHIEAHLDHLDEVVYDMNTTLTYRWYLNDDLTVSVRDKVNSEMVEREGLFCQECSVWLDATSVETEWERGMTNVGF